LYLLRWLVDLSVVCGLLLLLRGYDLLLGQWTGGLGLRLLLLLICGLNMLKKCGFNRLIWTRSSHTLIIYVYLSLNLGKLSLLLVEIGAHACRLEQLH